MTSKALRTTLAAGILTLSGCTREGDSNYSQMLQVVKSTFRASIGRQKVTRAQAAAIPYASMGWRLGGGNQSLVVLATDNGVERLWTSAARIVLVTRDSRLIRSVGLLRDLGGMTPGDSVRLPAPGEALRGELHTTRLADYPDLGQYGVRIRCDSRTAGREAVVILGHTTSTTRVDEVCYAASLRWHFTDRYWVDADGETVWRTRQHIHPQLDVVVTELFRPPG